MPKIIVSYEGFHQTAHIERKVDQPEVTSGHGTLVPGPPEMHTVMEELSVAVERLLSAAGGVEVSVTLKATDYGNGPDLSNPMDIFVSYSGGNKGYISTERHEAD